MTILDFYLAKVTQNLLNQEGSFYHSQLPFTPSGNTRPRFFTNQLPLKTLQGLVMYEDGEIEGNFTNHSLQATGAKVLFDVGVPECVIQKRTGHKSLDALRAYERITPKQLQKFWQVLPHSHMIQLKRTPVPQNQNFNPLLLTLIKRTSVPLVQTFQFLLLIVHFLTISQWMFSLSSSQYQCLHLIASFFYNLELSVHLICAYLVIFGQAFK